MCRAGWRVSEGGGQKHDLTAWQVCRRALAYFRDDLGQIVTALALIVVMILAGVLAPVPLAIFLNIYSADRADPSDEGVVYALFAWVPRERTVAVIVTLALLTLGLKLLNEVLKGLQTYLSIRIGYRGRTRVQLALFQKLQQLSMRYHKSQPQGDAIYRLSYDTHGFQGIYNLVTGGAVNVLTILIMAGFMLTLDPLLTGVALLAVPLLWVTITRFGERLKSYNLAQREADSSLTTQVQRALATVGLVQAYNRQDDEHGRFSGSVRTYVAASLRLHWQEIVYWFVLGVILAVSTAAVFGVGAYQVKRGVIPLGTLLIFLSYVDQFFDPLNKLTASGASFQGSAAGVGRVLEVLDRDPVIEDRPGAAHLPVGPRALVFEGVGFQYRADTPVLRDIDFSAEPGRFIAFVGESGVGKTTLLNLLPRFYDPTEGVVRLGGHDVREVRLRDVRAHVALVLQENPILPATVAENIAYGRPDASDAEIHEAAELAGAATFIDALEHGYATEISEGGGNLSGGQRQRIAIARALLTGAPILVLDEPTSALDAKSEQRVNDTLLDLKRRRTVIVVSHRLSTVLDADVIHVMDAGRIVERGTHAELVERRGLYWQMARHQLRLEPEAGAV